MIRVKQQARLLAVVVGIAIASLVPVKLMAAEDDSPLSPSYMSKEHKDYWSKKVSKMMQDGKVTQEGYLKYYSDLWDKNVPAGQEVTIEVLAEKWAAMESSNPIDPEYKTAVWRRKHVENMDTDKDGKVSRDEFLKHMAGHWMEATKLAQSSTLSHDQAMEMISNPLDPRWHR
jgi:phage terminase small subunit